jgi:alpha-tubulin suppressor-like RCC1 family protein
MRPALVLLLFACCGESEPLWVVRLDDASLYDSVRLVRARILENGCMGTTELHAVEIEPMGAAPAAPALEPGRYGFAAQAIDAECRVVARGCLEVDLPIDEDRIVVTLESGAVTEVCPIGTCSNGRCDERAVIAVGTGRGHSCASLYGGELYCWGYNVNGQVGNGGVMEAHSPVLIADDFGASELALGGIEDNWQGHSCAMQQGRVFCWGYNAYGQVGDGSMMDDRRIPTRVMDLDDAAAIDTGGTHTCAARDSGSLVCWGHDDFGQLGNGSPAEPQLVPAPSSAESVVEIAAGHDHTCVRIVSGTIQCSGRNSEGQLGDGTTEDRDSFGGGVDIGGPAIAVGAGFYHSCAVRNDGALFCWGDNGLGQLGSAAGAIATTPVMVPVGAALDVQGGDGTTCALLADRTVSCWGNSQFGQTGTGATGSMEPPGPVVGVDDALAIAYGSDHGCAIRTSGDLVCWGRNQWGRLGDGTTTDRFEPVVVIGPSL